MRAILLLPFVVLIVIPASIYSSIEFDFNNFFFQIDYIYFLIFGSVFLLFGLQLFIRSIYLFIKIGNGTLAPWDPTKNLVVVSLYKYIRNPMIVGVIVILVAEALLFRSLEILIWSFVFFITCHFYFKWIEEPNLIKRFGDEYVDYCKTVPRWIPEIKKPN